MASLKGGADLPLLGRPIAICFEGFKSDTAQMQRRGWQISSNEEDHGSVFMLHFYHPTHKLTLLSDTVDTRSFRDRNTMFERMPDLNVWRISSEYIQPAALDFNTFHRIDAVQQLALHSYTRRHFAEATPETKSIIIEPSSVQECLDLIAKMQVPVMKEVRKNEAKRYAQIANISALRA
jgi:hypothetical protein